MRELQARWSLIHGEYIDWDENGVTSQGQCGGPGSGQTQQTPPFPPDGFFDGLKCDPRRAAAITHRLWELLSSSEGDQVIEAFRPDLVLFGHTEQVEDEFHTVADLMADVEEPNPDNYCEAFQRMSVLLWKLQATEIAQTEGGVVEYAALGYGCQIFAESYGAAGCTCVFVPEPEECPPGWECFGCTPDGGPPPPKSFRQALDDCLDIQSQTPSSYSFDQIGARFEWVSTTCEPNCEGDEPFSLLSETVWAEPLLAASSPRLRGSAVVWAGTETIDDGNGYLGVPEDTEGYYTQYGRVDLPGEWTRPLRDLGTGFQNPQQTNTPEANGEAAWSPIGTRLVTTIQPRFDSEPDRVVSNSSCSECLAGRVDATLDGVHIRLSLGGYGPADAGYLLVRGATIVGWGDELYEFDPISEQITPGTGAIELVSREALTVHIPPTTSGYVRYPSQQHLPIERLKFPEGLAVISEPTGGSPTLKVEFYDNDQIHAGTSGWVPNSATTPAQTVTIVLSMDLEPTILAEQYDSVGTLTVTETGRTSRTRAYTERRTFEHWKTPTQDYIYDDFEAPQGSYADEGDHGPWIDQHSRLTLTTGVLQATQTTESLVHGYDEGLDARTETREIRDGFNNVVWSVTEWYLKHTDGLTPPGAGLFYGEVLVQRAEGVHTSAPRVTYWEYEGNALQHPQLVRVVHPNGFWQEFEYDTDGRLERVVSRYLDRPGYTAADHSVTEYAYHRADLGDYNHFGGGDPQNLEWISEIVQKLPEINSSGSTVGSRAIARQYTIYWDMSPAPGQKPGEYDTTFVACADAEGPTSLVAFLDTACDSPLTVPDLVSHVLEANTPLFQGPLWHRTASVRLEADGSVVYTTYSDLSGRFGRASRRGEAPLNFSILDSGVSAIPLDASWRWTLEEEVISPVGVVLERTTSTNNTDQFATSPNSTLVIDHTEVTDTEGPDLEGGRATVTEYFDGTIEEMIYEDCCRTAERIDRSGISTLYEYDELGRVERVGRQVGAAAYIYTEYEYDALGRVTSTTRRGTDNSTIITGQTTYTDFGEVASHTDAMGNVD